ncbi:MAG: pitrilysin family protein [Pseudomonadota bacterium]
MFSASRKIAHYFAALGLLMLATVAAAPAYAAETSRPVHSFKLDNGMQVVVIPDRRAPVVTHMVWYRVGAADEPPGKSGIAHFLEHLMFKSTETLATGEFSRTVAKLGGQDNAFTSQDATAYFQRISRDHLETVMRMEADRMVNLRLVDKEVETERDVVIEERNSRVENRPASLLNEHMDAALYMSHPNGIPVIGWMHEIKELDRQDALDFYKEHYGPNNAILIVAGDVTEDEVKRLATATYGKVPANERIVKRKRTVEPPQLAPRRMTLEDESVGQPSWRRYYLAPSYHSAKTEGEAEALDLMMKLFASGTTSRLYQSLVVDKKIASSISGYFAGYGLDNGKIVIAGIPAEGVTLAEFEAAIDKEIEIFKKTGVTEEDLKRIVGLYTAEYIYETDSQSTLARRYGWGMVNGSTIEEIDGWPKAIAKVTPDDVKRVAAKYFNANASVTGKLIPKSRDAADASSEKAGPAKSKS